MKNIRSTNTHSRFCAHTRARMLLPAVRLCQITLHRILQVFSAMAIPVSKI